jgi:hypothetical protein
MAQINKPTDYFNTVTYSGNSSTNAITGVGHQPDLVWIKCRNATASHLWQDSVRGKSGSVHYYLESDNSESEKVQTDGDGISTMDSDGYTITYGNSGAWNQTGRNYVSWNWKANGTASSNTDGSITSSVSANTTAGFSIAKFTGTGANATIGHGLNSAPEMIIEKGLDSALNWKMYHKSLGAGKYINFDEANGAVSATVTWNNTAPTSSVFSVGNGNNNNSGEDYVAYCFHSVKGYSKVNSYIGNGNSNGAFITTNFRPGYILIRGQGLNVDWYVFDCKRNGINTDTIGTANRSLRSNTNATEANASGYYLDICSNGFKIRTNNQALNSSGEQYIYYAVAEQPLVGTNNIPATAR